MTESSPHKLTLCDRHKLSVTGVNDVVSFDDNAVIMTTDLGTLTVHGSGLQLKTLSTEGGQVAVDGQISAMIYEEPRPAGLLKRLLGQ